MTILLRAGIRIEPSVSAASSGRYFLTAARRLLLVELELFLLFGIRITATFFELGAERAELLCRVLAQGTVRYTDVSIRILAVLVLFVATLGGLDGFLISDVTRLEIVTFGIQRFALAETRPDTRVDGTTREQPDEDQAEGEAHASRFQHALCGLASPHERDILRQRFARAIRSGAVLGEVALSARSTFGRCVFRLAHGMRPVVAQLERARWMSNHGATSADLFDDAEQ